MYLYIIIVTDKNKIDATKFLSSITRKKFNDAVKMFLEAQGHQIREPEEMVRNSENSENNELGKASDLLLKMLGSGANLGEAEMLDLKAGTVMLIDSLEAKYIANPQLRGFINKLLLLALMKLGGGAP